MLIFIDESGDAGFKIEKGSSKYFVVVFVIFCSELDAQETANKIKKLRQDLNKSEKFEFKFNKCNKELRIKFLTKIKNCNFKIKAFVFNKELITPTGKGNFYNLALSSALNYEKNNIHNAKIRLDGLGDKNFRQDLLGYLKNNLTIEQKQIINNLRFRDSKKDVLIQLSDMVAGSVRRSFDNQVSDKEIYRKTLRIKKDDVVEMR